MKRPAAGFVRGHEKGQPFARFDKDGMLVGAIVALPVVQFAPQPMQVDRMFHHGVVDQHEAHTTEIKLRKQLMALLKFRRAPVQNMR